MSEQNKRYQAMVDRYLLKDPEIMAVASKKWPSPIRPEEVQKWMHEEYRDIAREQVSAMLAELLDHGCRWESDEEQTIVRKDGHSDHFSGPGWLVFIPDEPGKVSWSKLIQRGRAGEASADRRHAH